MELIAGSLMVIGSIAAECATYSQRKRNSKMMQKAAERVAEAELKCKKHLQDTEDAYTALHTQVEGIAIYLDGPFTELYKPFEGPNTSLLGGLVGAEKSTALDYVQNVSIQRNFKGLRQLPGYRKQIGHTFLFCNRVGEVLQQKNAAETQRSVARLIEADSDSLCMALDLQKENYNRAQKTLQALNVALLKTSAQVRQAMSSIARMLDAEGHIPATTTLEALTGAFTLEQADQIAINLNIAKCMAAILAEPMFNEKAEITERMEKLFREGEQALEEIQAIRNGGNPYGKH